MIMICCIILHNVRTGKNGNKNSSNTKYTAIATETNNVMHHVTKYCNVIGRTVQRTGTRLVYAVHQMLPSLAEVGLACKTRSGSGVRITKENV